MRITVVVHQVLDCLRVSVALSDPSELGSERQHGFTVFDVRIPSEMRTAEDYVALLAESLLDAAYGRNDRAY